MTDSRAPRSRTGLRSLVGAACVLVSGGLVGACGGDSARDTIDRETFIEAYVQLRVAALDTDSGRVAASDRETILSGLGVTEAELLAFAEVHATDLEFMRDVWNDVELRLDRPAATPEGR